MWILPAMKIKRTSSVAGEHPGSVMEYPLEILLMGYYQTERPIHSKSCLMVLEPSIVLRGINPLDTEKDGGQEWAESKMIFKLEKLLRVYKTILFCLQEGADPEVTMCVKTSETVKAEETEEDTIVKLKEEDMVVCDSEDVKLELDGITLPCIHLPQISGNPDPTTSAIMLTEMKPWCHIVRPFSLSQIPEQVAKCEDIRQGRTHPIKWAGFWVTCTVPWSQAAFFLLESTESLYFTMHSLHHVLQCEK
ncbi:hypothetical protein DEU56DRAFT_759009 [Suillus clintonianus]|uniref:uncharacterized protein n=1 Tax=Suillus clintonianus TaxID=1904413 RepID=UPI001B862237|nr:uncharacterized protein DEU56DRAFT_759009 [Suillus clintonianus]KAG2126042.1 hypothetical protein DEU56DRAFT_759009 [Suillus clintonianus]